MSTHTYTQTRPPYMHVRTESYMHVLISHKCQSTKPSLKKQQRNNKIIPKTNEHIHLDIEVSAHTHTRTITNTSLHIRGSAKKFTGWQTLSWNETKWGLFFNIPSLVVRKLFPSILDPIGQKLINSRRTFLPLVCVYECMYVCVCV